MVRFRKQSAPETADRLQGYIHTVWSDAGGFIRRFNQVKAEAEPDERFDDAHALQTVIAIFTDLAR
jgi:predicted metal-dependent enzyme (double-stranded beta helix superfamily)